MEKIDRANILPAIALGLFVILVFTISEFDSGERRAALKIGFVMTGNRNDSGWNGKHYAAVRKVCDEYGFTLLMKENVAENTGACPKAVDELAAEGANVIFLSSFGYPAEMFNLTENYPQISFCGIVAEPTAPNMTAYFARMYQGRYLAGIIAGRRTKSGTIGYVAAMPNAEVNRGINAFALGVQSVNPAARVAVCWTNSWQDAEKESANVRRLVKEAGADVITYHQNQATSADAADALGVDFIGYHERLEGYSEHYLTSVVCRWEKFYGDMMARYLKGELTARKTNWLGVESDVVYLSEYSSVIDDDTRKRVERTQREMLEDRRIFAGEIYDNEGKLRCGADEVISDDILLTRMDWLVKGVNVLD